MDLRDLSLVEAALRMGNQTRELTATYRTADDRIGMYIGDGAPDSALAREWSDRVKHRSATRCTVANVDGLCANISNVYGESPGAAYYTPGASTFSFASTENGYLREYAWHTDTNERVRTLIAATATCIP